MPFELVMVIGVEAFDVSRENDPPDRFLIRLAVRDGAVHAFDLTIRPGMLRLACPVLDAERRAGIFEGVRPDGFALRQAFDTGRCC